MTAFDGFIHMGPIVDMRGDPETTDYYERMLDELDERIRNGVGAIREERYRVLWDNLPIWYKIGDFSKWLGGHGTGVGGMCIEKGTSQGNPPSSFRLGYLLPFCLQYLY